jgi:hypothetical protein
MFSGTKEQMESLGRVLLVFPVTLLEVNIRRQLPSLQASLTRSELEHETIGVGVNYRK